MRLNYIELKNYRKFEHVRLELPDGIIGIVGDNGVGKSTLVESIAWALFGNQKDIVRAGKESIRKDDAKAGEPTMAKLEFTYAGDEYVVKREMSGKSLSIDASLIVNMKRVATGSNEVSNFIEKKLGMDYKSFFISVFAKQKDLAALSSLTERERRITVMRMLGIDRLDDVLKEVSRREELRREKVETSRAMLVDEKGHPKQKSLEMSRNELLQGNDIIEKEISALRREQEVAKRDEMNIEQRLSEISKRLKSLREAKNKLEVDEANLAASKKEFERIKKNLEEAQTALVATSKLEELNKEIVEMRKKHEKLTALSAEHDRIVKSKSELESLEEEISSLEEQIAINADEVKKNAELLKSIEEGKGQLESIDKEISELRDRQAQIREQLRNLREDAESDEKHLKEIDDLGPDSICPTCERPLGDHHASLKKKLATSINETKVAIRALEVSQRKLEDHMGKLLQNSESSKKKGEALAKEEKHLLQIEREIEVATRNLESVEAKRKKLDDEIRKSDSIAYDQSELDGVADRLESLNEKRDGLMEMASLAKKVPELRRSLANATQEIERYERSIEQIRLDPTEIEILESTTSELEGRRSALRKKSYEIYESIVELTKKQESMSAEITKVRRELDSLMETEKKLKTLEEDLAYSVKLSELMKGFRNNLVARIIPTLSQIASDLLSQLTERRYSSLTLDDGYNIFIEDGGEKHVLERFSGGESDLANLCLRLAISRVIAERTSTEGINLLVLDEIFGSQDASRKRNLMMSFNALSKQFRQIMLITHIDDIREHLTSVIEVYQDERGTSHARLAE